MDHQTLITNGVLLNDPSFKSIGASSRNQKHQTVDPSQLQNLASRSLKPSRNNILEADEDQTTTIDYTMASNIELKGPFHKRHKSVLSNYDTRNLNLNSKSTLDQRSGSQLMRPVASKKVLDYSCGDPYYNIKKEQRQEYEQTHGLNRAIEETM